MLADPRDPARLLQAGHDHVERGDRNHSGGRHTGQCLLRGQHPREQQQHHPGDHDDIGCDPTTYQQAQHEADNTDGEPTLPAHRR
jgi:hypothetical protein